MYLLFVYLLVILTEQKISRVSEKHSNFLNSSIHQCYLNDANIVKLYVLHQSGSDPSRSLCQDMGMRKCGNLCCHDCNYGFHHFQRNDEEQILDKTILMDAKTLRQKYCEIKNGKNYTNQCCQTDQNRLNSKNSEGYHLRVFHQLCNGSFNHQQECKNAGLLWCDGTCCGFSSSKHKCYKVNHYGLPYIRCPIEKSD